MTQRGIYKTKNKKIISKLIYKHFLSNESPLEYRVLSLVLIFGIVAEIISLVIRIIEGISVFSTLAVIAMLATTSLLFVLHILSKLPKYSIPIALFFICDILFPLIFFTNGGVNSGLIGYFVLCIILHFFFLSGKQLFIMLSIQTLIILGCYTIGLFFPHLVKPFTNDIVRYIDIIHTILIAGFLSGFIIKIQSAICEAEKAKVEAATKTKADFVANISHEIRTPLNAIIGLGELELAKDLPNDTLLNLEKMNSSGRILLGIINNLLDISKIESGSFELINDEYNTANLINDVVNLNIVNIGRKNVTFKLEIDENIPSQLYGDELRIKQILNNLLSNAIKYTKEGYVLLKVFCINKENKAFLIFTIEDSGIGIREENISKLFSAYQQVDSKINRTIEGTGLGLSICKNLVELMDGTVTIKSEYGKGSSFTTEIPQDITNISPIGREIAGSLTNFCFTTEKRDRRKSVRITMPYGKVLVVDDVSTNLDVAKGMLEPYHLSVDCVFSGKEAIILLQNEDIKYDAIFMDHLMPEQDGIDTVKIIRNEINSQYARNVPIIALTANAIIGNEEMFLANGFNDYITKPIDAAKLDIALHKWVRNKEKENSLEWAPLIEKLKETTIKKTEVSPPRIRGVDLDEGLKRMGNKEATYNLILSSFIKNMPALLDKIRDFRPSEIKNYILNIHGIKGSSYGISANEIGKEAETLEMAAKIGDIETILTGNDYFIERMEDLIEDITKYLSQHKPE